MSYLSISSDAEVYVILLHQKKLKVIILSYHLLLTLSVSFMNYFQWHQSFFLLFSSCCQ